MRASVLVSKILELDEAVQQVLFFLWAVTDCTHASVRCSGANISKGEQTVLADLETGKPRLYHLNFFAVVQLLL